MRIEFTETEFTALLNTINNGIITDKNLSEKRMALNAVREGADIVESTIHTIANLGPEAKKNLFDLGAVIVSALSNKVGVKTEPAKDDTKDDKPTDACKQEPVGKVAVEKK